MSVLARSRRAGAHTMMAAENSSPNPLLQRARRAAASLAVVLSLALPGYVAPGAAAAQPPTTPATEQQKNGPAKSDSAVQKIQEKAELFGEILADLQDLYVEPVDLDKLAETGFQAMLSSLDPYTEFENVEAAKVMRTQTIGNYGGVGLVITKNKDTKGNDQPYISVVNSFEGYAFDAGMRVGDTLISVDGKDVKDTSTNDVSLMLKGEPGSKVALKYKRPGLDQVQVLPLSFAYTARCECGCEQAPGSRSSSGLAPVFRYTARRGGLACVRKRLSTYVDSAHEMRLRVGDFARRASLRARLCCYATFLWE